jgi:DNA-binding NtrC family response regulator
MAAEDAHVDTPQIVKKAIVLIVEDESLVRFAAVDFIRDAGFETLEARNADEAISILEAHLDIRIVFTDIDMPGSMDRLKLAIAIRGRWPPVEIIVTSGKYSFPPGGPPARGEFVPKPYAESVIVTALRRMAA